MNYYALSALPISPVGRSTRITIRIAKTIEGVQSLPGECHDRPSLSDPATAITIAPRIAPEPFNGVDLA